MSTTPTLIGKVAAVAAAGLATYEALAVVADLGPTVTELVEALPELVELGLILGLSLWLLAHFGWLRRLGNRVLRGNGSVSRWYVGHRPPDRR